MRWLTMTVFGLACSFNSISQTTVIDSLKAEVAKAKTDTGKAHNLYLLSYRFQKYKPDSALLLAQLAYTLSIKSKYLQGQSASLGLMGGAFNRLGNFSKALEYYIQQLKIVERQNDPENTASAFLSIALVYNSQKDAAKALYYAYKADSLIKANKKATELLFSNSLQAGEKTDSLTKAINQLSEFLLYTSLDIGDIYFNDNRLDSALVYAKQCYTTAIQQKDDLITGTALNNMGNIYFKSGEFMAALISFKSSIPYLEKMQDNNTLAECYLGLATSFNKLQQPDSALYFANKSFQISSSNQFLKHALNASGFLAELYKQQNRVDSAFAYQQTYIALKDSFDNTEKIKQLQSLTIAEQLRQQLISEQLIQEKKDRRLKLELLLIGMFIPILFFISAFLSRSKVHRKLIRFSGIFSLLFLFEYITLLLHPLVAKSTDHSPILEILVFVAIAGVISPTHHKIEHWLVEKLTERHNNRLSAAAKAPEEDEVQVSDE